MNSHSTKRRLNIHQMSYVQNKFKVRMLLKANFITPLHMTKIYVCFL